jgi:hypothetical protein
MLFRKPKASLQLGSTPFDSIGPTNDYPLIHNAPLLQAVGPSSSITVKGIALATRSANHVRPTRTYLDETLPGFVVGSYPVYMNSIGEMTTTSLHRSGKPSQSVKYPQKEKSGCNFASAHV